MSNKNFDMLPQELKDCKSTLKKLSYDDKNKEYMIESDIEAIDFDKVKEIYVKNNLEMKTSSNMFLLISCYFSYQNNHI